MLMAEGHRLRLAHARQRDVSGPLDGVAHPNQSGDYEDSAENRGASERIRAAMKDLRHSLLRSGSKRPGGAYLNSSAVGAIVLVRKRKPPTGFQSRLRN